MGSLIIIEAVVRKNGFPVKIVTGVLGKRRTFGISLNTGKIFFLGTTNIYPTRTQPRYHDIPKPLRAKEMRQVAAIFKPTIEFIKNKNSSPAPI